MFESCLKITPSPPNTFPHEEHLKVLDKFTKVISHIRLPAWQYRRHPEIVLWNHVTERNPAQFNGTNDGQGTVVAPFFMQATFPEMFVYTGDRMDVPCQPLPRTSDFLPSVPQKEGEEYQYELRVVLPEI